MTHNHNYTPLKQFKKSRFMIKLTLIFSLFLLMISLRLQKSYTDLSIREKLSLLMEQSRSVPYHRISSIQNHQQLPFCLILTEQQNRIPLNYTNYHYVSVDKRMKLADIRKFIKVGCQFREIVLLVDGKLKKNSLLYLNVFYQTQSVWLLFRSKNFSLISFYASLIDKFETNAKNNKLNPFIRDNLMSGGILALMELTQYHMAQPTLQEIFQSENSPMMIVDELQLIDRQVVPYSPMYSLTESLWIDEVHRSSMYKLLFNNYYIDRLTESVLTMEQMIQVMEYRSLPYLPLNHSLAQRQRRYYKGKYNIDYQSKELPMCVVMLSHNNNENERYKRVLDSIMIQQYKNYRILFIDDHSKDSTLEVTKTYAQRIGLNDITYIANKEQKYATYNLKHASEECKTGEIMVIVDGDDQLVGKQVFKLINHFYTIENKWIVYSNFYNSQYAVGKSKPLLAEHFSYQERPQFHVIGPLRTFRVQLFRKIKDQDHRDDKGQYLDTLYDDAMQYPLLEMAGPEHATYIGEICYFYNTNYQGNDDSTFRKQRHRHSVYLQILKRPPYDRINDI